MANNRLWAVCTDDNDVEIVTKFYPPNWVGIGDNSKNLDAWFLKHQECPSNNGCGENIQFVTEVPSDPRVELYDFRGERPKIIFKK